MRHFESSSLTTTSASTRQRSPRRSATKSRRVLSLLLASATVIPGSGCGLLKKVPPGKHDTTASYHDNHSLNIEYPEVAQCAVSSSSAAAQQTSSPHSLEDPSNLPTYDLSLAAAVNLAVQQSPVLRSIGGTIVTTPQGAATVYDPGLAAASPTQGTEAALAAFDAQFSQQLFWSTTDQPNNVARGGITEFFTPPANEGTNVSSTSELSKQTATGAKFALRHVVNYSRTNQPGRAFSSAFDGWVEAEWRQPLLQGAGTTYNRIAGPAATPGQYNGVLIARLNEDIALADFEESIINLVADVEQAYWDLVTAYRILNTTVSGREAALQTFQYQQVRLEVGSGRSDEEAQARSQYYQFQAQVESALGGANGLYAAEQKLRYLIGLAATDGRLLRPTAQPIDAKIVFDWESALGQSLQRRVEVRRQRFGVKRRDLELVAARLNLKPRLDLIGQYRWRGLGDRLIGDTTGGPLDNLYGTIAGGDYQQGQLGVEMTFPVGLRAAALAVAHAKLNAKRERALLEEVELRVSHDLSDAARQISLTYQLLDTNYNRYLADQHQVDVLRRRYRDGSDNINFLLQAQRQVVTSETEFYRSLTNYNLAIRDFHRQKGSLLAYNHVQLAEGPWAAGAAQDAYQAGRFLTPRRDPSKVTAPRPLTTGPFDPSAVQASSGVGVPPAVEGLLPEIDSMKLEDVQPLPPPSGDPTGTGLIGSGPSWFK